jgi:hypothetical protein
MKPWKELTPRQRHRWAWLLIAEVSAICAVTGLGLFLLTHDMAVWVAVAAVWAGFTAFFLRLASSPETALRSGTKWLIGPWAAVSIASITVVLVGVLSD